MKLKSPQKSESGGFNPNRIIVRYVYRPKQYSPVPIKGSLLPRGCTLYTGFIQSLPWLLDWTHWLKWDFNDLLSQVLIRCRQTALCGTGQGWRPGRTEFAGLQPAWMGPRCWTATRSCAGSTSFPLRRDIMFSPPGVVYDSDVLVPLWVFFCNLPLLLFYHLVNYLEMRQKGIEV